MKLENRDWRRALLMALGSDEGLIPSLIGVGVQDGHIVLVTGEDAPDDLQDAMRTHTWLRLEKRNPENESEMLWYFRAQDECCVSCEVAHLLTKLCGDGVKAPNLASSPRLEELEGALVGARVVRIGEGEDIADVLGRVIAEDIAKLRAGSDRDEDERPTGRVH